jgi:hypothetical protein
MCLRPLDMFINDKLQSRQEGMLLKLCLCEARSENKFTVYTF